MSWRSNRSCVYRHVTRRVLVYDPLFILMLALCTTTVYRWINGCDPDPCKVPQMWQTGVIALAVIFIQVWILETLRWALPDSAMSRVLVLTLVIIALLFVLLANGRQVQMQPTEDCLLLRMEEQRPQQATVIATTNTNKYTPTTNKSRQQQPQHIVDFIERKRNM